MRLRARRTGAVLTVLAAATAALAPSAPPRPCCPRSTRSSCGTSTPRTRSATPPFVPHVALINRAMVHGAVYDAVNGVTRTHRPYLVQVEAQPGDSVDAAAATAAFRMLTHLFPAQSAALQTKYDTALAAVPDGPAKLGGITDGEQAATAMIAARTGDGRGGPADVVIGTEPGQWRPTPPAFAVDPAPWAGNVKPFLVPDVAALRSDGPNALTSSTTPRTSTR
ncbi:hypothetical protein ACFQZ4_45400 [Catellatospora coxensis]